MTTARHASPIGPSVLFWVFLAVSVSSADDRQASVREPAPTTEAQSDSEPEEGQTVITKGMTVWGLQGGFGVAHQIWGGRADRQFLALGGRIGKVLSRPAGPGVLRGQVELDLELLPAFVMFQQETTYAFSFTILARHYLRPGAATKPFVVLGAGTVFSTKDVPEETTGVNFTPQIGVGVAFFPKPKLAYGIEYRLHHISNAGLADPNPGINSSTVLFTTTLFR